MVKIFLGWRKSMCEGYEGKQKDDSVKKQGDYCGWNRESKKKGKLMRWGNRRGRREKTG